MIKKLDLLVEFFDIFSEYKLFRLGFHSLSRGAGNRTRVAGPPALNNNHYTTPRRRYFTSTNIS